MKRAACVLLGVLVAGACRDDSAPTDPDTTPSQDHAAADPPVLVGAGDIGLCEHTDDEATAALLDGIHGTVFTAGDNAYPNGTAEDFANCYEPSWGRHKARTWPAVGNHEYHTPGAGPYYAYFGAAAGDSGLGYYSKDLGAWHVVVLNSVIDMRATSPQMEWLRQDLAASDKSCTIAIWHHPRFSSGEFSGSNPKSQAVWDLLYDVGAEIVLSAHEHHYERFAPQTAGGAANPSYGIREFIVGMGGSSNYPFRATPLATSEVRDNTTPGVLKLTLRDGGYDWQFVGTSKGTFTDAGSGTCHGVPPNARPTASPGSLYVSRDGTVHFDGSASSDPDGNTPLTYRWDFGDGNVNEDGARPSHTYARDGFYLVRLQVRDTRGAWSATRYTIASVRNTETAVVLAGAGNIARCSNTNADSTAALLDALPGYAFTAGDNAFPHATAAEYANCYHPTWGRHRTRTLAVLGNHEYDGGNADAAFDYFGARAGPRNQGYYSTNLGDWHVIVLNDNSAFVPFAAGSAQDRWLQADLAANTRPCTIALWHQPRFFSSDEPGWTERTSRRILWDRLAAAGVDVVVNGHQHHYERLAPMRADGTRDDVAGMRQFNVGTGGESLALPTISIHPHSEVRAAVYGVLKLTLRTAGYDWEFLAAAGQSFTDRGTGTCR